MYFIVRTKAAMILSNDLTWLRIRTLQKEDMDNLLSVKTIEAAQSLCKWFANGVHTVSPVTSKTIKTKWDVNLSLTDKDSFTKGIQSKRYPKYLKQVPVSKKQTAEFQQQWVKEEPVHTLLQTDSAGTSTQEESAYTSAQNANAEKTSFVPVSAAAETAPLAPAAPVEETLSSKPVQRLNLTATTPVREKSALINEVDATFSAFGQLVQQIPGMLEEKQGELAAIEKKLLDLRHIAELHTDLNTVEGYRLYKEQRDTLRKRRTLKDEVSVLAKAVSLFTGAIDLTKICSLTMAINDLDSRQYHPRAILESEVAEIIRSPKTLDCILGR